MSIGTCIADGHATLKLGPLRCLIFVEQSGWSRGASVAGSLAGNHFLTLTEGTEHFDALGQLVQWEGAQDITFELL